MITVKNAEDRLKALGITGKVRARGSDTFFVKIDMETSDHIDAYNKSIPIYRILEANGMVLACDGGHVGDHGDGYQTYELIVNFNPPEPEVPKCPKCGSELTYYSIVRFVECTNPACDYTRS